MQVKAGTLWEGSGRSKFIVISVTEVEGHTWVYYRDNSNKTAEPREYSCYEESFVQRFKPLLNEG